MLVDLAALDLRSYIAEPARGRRNWKRKAGTTALIARLVVLWTVIVSLVARFQDAIERSRATRRSVSRPHAIARELPRERPLARAARAIGARLLELVCSLCATCHAQVNR